MANMKATLASFGHEGLNPTAGEILSETVDFLRNHVQEGIIASQNTDNTKYDVTPGHAIVSGVNVFTDAVTAPGPGPNKVGCLQLTSQGTIEFFEDPDHEPEKGKVKICDLTTDGSSIITVDNTTRAVCPPY
jgi:hypothetical protein